MLENAPRCDAHRKAELATCIHRCTQTVRILLRKEQFSWVVVSVKLIGDSPENRGAIFRRVSRCLSAMEKEALVHGAALSGTLALADIG
jgi:hypothetical protein